MVVCEYYIYAEIVFMRMRKKKHGDERIRACSDILLVLDKENKTLEGLEELNIASDRPLCLEIGCGKGAFITELAAQNPEVFYIAVERVPNVIIAALEKVRERQLKNVRFVIGNALDVCEALPEHSIDRLYLNFSDPWPKKGYAKRRLTHRGFLEVYKRILKEDGVICFKTDNRGLFDFSLEEFPAAGYILDAVTYDLHNSEYSAGNIMTEYEKNFSEKGVPINRCEARPERT